MITRVSVQHRLTVAETQEPDRSWFEQRPERTQRLRLPTFDDLRDYGTKTTHIIVTRRGVKQLSRVPITLPASSDAFHVSLLMKDTPNDRVQDLSIVGLMNAIRGGRRINFDEIHDRVSMAYR